jgi:purine-binding chemotaxis protein CheW
MKSRQPPGKRAIDWQQIRQRLAKATTATEEAAHLSPERARAVLAERARALARVSGRAVPSADLVHVATFALGNERYGIETRYVREVVRFTDYTPVPGTPDFLVGLTNLRGEVLAVIDLRKFLGVARQEVTDLARLIVLGDQHAEFGVLADAAHEVLPLRFDEIHEPPASVAGIGREYLRGVTPDALIVLDGAVLLRDGRLFIDQGEEAGG